VLGNYVSGNADGDPLTGARRRVLILRSPGKTRSGGELEQVAAVQNGWLAIVARDDRRTA